jgi:hypothetical protein
VRAEDDEGESRGREAQDHGLTVSPPAGRDQLRRDGTCPRRPHGDAIPSAARQALAPAPYYLRRTG